jgi:hypothetical protein
MLHSEFSASSRFVPPTLACTVTPPNPSVVASGSSSWPRPLPVIAEEGALGSRKSRGEKEEGERLEKPGLRHNQSR